VSRAAALKLLSVGLDVDVEVEFDVDVDVEVELDVDVEVDVDVEHEVGADCAQATPDSPRENNSMAATAIVAKTSHMREKLAIVTSRTACRWDRRSPPG
jgi:hypothetical protein